MHSPYKQLGLILCCTSVIGVVGTQVVLGAEDARRSPLAVSGDEGRPLPSEDMDTLIAQLGSDRYILRRQAQHEFQRIGIGAFDKLHLAQAHADPEIAASAEYLLGQIAIPWIEMDDPSSVRRLMDGYEDLPDELRLERIAALGELTSGQGTGALCRIVRFDPAEHVSRSAAMAVLGPRQTGPRPHLREEEIVRQLGGSRRQGAKWVRLYLDQVHDPAATVSQWERLADGELRSLGDGASDLFHKVQPANRSAERPADEAPLTWPSGTQANDEVTTRRIAVDLLWHLMKLYQELGRMDDARAVTTEILELDSEQFEETAAQLIDWLAEVQAWDAVDQLLLDYDSQFAHTRRAQYIAAIARRRQGKDQLAEELARRALEADAGRPLARVTLANYLLEQRQQYEWAKREYRRTIDSDPPESHASLLARTWLARLLHDLEENQQAATVLEDLETKIEQDSKFRQMYNQARRDFLRGGASYLLDPQQITARRHYFLAAHHHQQQNWDREREHLAESIRLEPADADVVIAMYRLPNMDDEWRDDVRRRIIDLSRRFQRKIDEDPQKHAHYNQWAWLISNTEGDYKKAIRYSQRSLELLPEGANPGGYLDTLGRCYYAAGDFEKAVEVQRQAVEHEPSMQVLRRQLALFEKSLADSNTPKNSAN